MDIMNRVISIRGLQRLVVLSLIILMGRMILSQEITHLFLIWNLFLGLIPFGLAISDKPSTKAINMVRWAVVILFLPNAPYLFTDLIHLVHSNSRFFWVDFTLFMTFGLTGMASFLLTCQHLCAQLPVPPKMLKAGIYPLTAVGLYLGRTGRFNSWDPLIHPLRFVSDLFEFLLSEPMVFLTTVAAYTAFVYAFDVLLLTRTTNHKDVPEAL